MTTVTESIPTHKLISVKDAAARYSVAWRTLLRWADAGLVPVGIRIGGRRLWRVEDIDKHIEGGCRPLRQGRKVAIK